jgi:hypothetical protein
MNTEPQTMQDLCLNINQTTGNFYYVKACTVITSGFIQSIRSKTIRNRSRPLPVQIQTRPSNICFRKPHSRWTQKYIKINLMMCTVQPRCPSEQYWTETRQEKSIQGVSPTGSGLNIHAPIVFIDDNRLRQGLWPSQVSSSRTGGGQCESSSFCCVRS